MSSANVYRFFPSKNAIVEALCGKILGALLETATAAANAPGPASERVFNLLLTLHRHHRDHLTNHERVHEMVVVAMDENWGAIHAFFERCKGLVAKLIAEGQAAGEFGPGEPAQLADLTFAACSAFLHPMMIAKCASQGLSVEEIDLQAQGVVAFALRALASNQPLPQFRPCQLAP
jgi:AcrR family transcriptional regulator